MIAMIALLATVLPNVGPIGLKLKLARPPNSWSSAGLTSADARRRSASSVEIWKPLPPSSLSLTRWIFASPRPSAREHVADAVLVGLLRRARP